MSKQKPMCIHFNCESLKAYDNNNYYVLNESFKYDQMKSAKKQRKHYHK